MGKDYLNCDGNRSTGNPVERIPLTLTQCQRRENKPNKALAMKLIEKNQLIGMGDGFAVFRDLVEDENGVRHSIRTSEPFWMEDERKMGESYTPLKELFEKVIKKQCSLVPKEQDDTLV